MTPPAVRSLRPDDAEAAAVVIHASFRAQEVGTDPPPGALNETPATVRALIEAGGGGAVEHDGCLAATILWREAEGGLYFGHLAVLPAFRRRGFAQALIAAAEAEACRRNLPRVHCGARLVLAGNHRLFAACGFHEFRRPFEAKYGAVVSADWEKHL